MSLLEDKNKYWGDFYKNEDAPHDPSSFAVECGSIIRPSSKILEIGSNDGVFIKNFDADKSVCIEPCGNFAKMTNDAGYKTYNEFASKALFTKVQNEHGKIDIVFAANCMCHIQNIYEIFESIGGLLSDDGVLIIEDPSLLHTIQNNA